MKQGIHPTTHPVAFEDVSTGQKVLTTSTLTSKDEEVIDGVKYFVIRTDITAFSHPFFTGEVRYVDRKGRIDKFVKKQQVAQTAAKAKTKATVAKADPKSYKDILRDTQRELSGKGSQAAPAATKSVKPAAAPATSN